MALVAKVCVLVLSALVALSSVGNGRKIKDGKEAWGYENIRPDAYTFWWLYYSTTPGNYLEKPLVLWLQGGPGASSTGYGNFMEIGALDVKLQQRNTTWVQDANVLFVDNPVGTGFSYVTNKTALASNNTQIADDLLALLKAFLQKLPEFEKVPLYIFAESYGGKMAAGFAKVLNKAIEAQKIKCSFKGVALGDSWISPLDSVMTWGAYLYATSFVDETGLDLINAAANNVKQALAKGDYKAATQGYDTVQNVIEKYANGVDFYNILNTVSSSKSLKTVLGDPILNRLYSRHVGYFQEDELAQLMNGKIKEKLRIPTNVTWGGQSGDVFTALSTDFMLPVIDDVEYLLNSTQLLVTIYNGQLDLIVDTLGTTAWVQKLKWLGLKMYNNSTRTAILSDDGKTAGFVKSFKNLSFYWILRSGHMVPADADKTALKMLNLITKRG